MIIIPFSFEKDLGKEYNRAMAADPDDYTIIMDVDAIFLLPSTPKLIDDYVKKFPMGAVYTGYASRSHKSSAAHWPRMNTGNFLEAINIAEHRQAQPMAVTQITRNLTGFFMVIKKETWLRHKFNEGEGILDIDTKYWRKLIAANELILRMETVFIWHTYRLKQGIGDKSHLL